MEILKKLVQFSKNNSILIFIFSWFLAVETYIWFSSKRFPGLNPSESFMAYLAAKNFVKYSILNLHFLDDYSTSSIAAAHPFLSTHSPNIQTFVSYILYKIGLHTISSQSFFTIFPLGIGLYYMYLTIKEYTYNKKLALITLILAVLSYKTVLMFGYCLFRSFSWIVVFAPLYYLKKYDLTGKNRFFWSGVIFYFLLSYFDYIIAAFVTILIILFKLFKFYKNISIKGLLKYFILGAFSSFLIHQVIVMSALGFNLYRNDFYLNLLNRLTGNPSRNILQNYYDSNGIVFFGVPGKLPLSQALLRVLNSLTAQFGFLVVFSISIMLTSILVKSALYIFSKLQKYKISIESRFFLCFSVATFIPTLIFSVNMMQIYANKDIFAPFFVFCVLIGLGILFYKIFRHIYSLVKAKKLFTGISFGLITSLIILNFLLVNFVYIKVINPIKPLPASNVLTKYKGHSFATNYISSYVNYFTDEWVNNAWAIDPNNPDISIRFFNNYLFEKDKLINSQKYQNPEYLFIVANPYSPEAAIFMNSEQIFKQYKLVEKGENFWIFDMKKSNY